MLKRIKIRGKLLLLLITPLLAVMVFAADGVMDRIERSDASAREAQLATFAVSTADLSTALQVEQFQTLLTGRLMGAFSSEVRPDEIATDEALIRWRREAAAVTDIIDDAELRAEIEAVEARLIDIVATDRGERFASEELAEFLDENARRLNDVLIDLQGEATSIDLFHTLDGLASLIAVQESLTDIVLIGDRSIAAGGGRSGGMAILVRDALTALTLAYDQAAATLDPAYSPSLAQLLADDQLPRLSGSTSGDTGGFDAIGEITAATQRGAVAGGVDWTTAGEERLTALNAVLTTIVGDAAAAAAFGAEQAEDEAGQYLILAASVAVLALAMAIIMGRSISRPLIQLTDNAQRLSSEELPAMVESMRTAGRTPAPLMTPIQASGRDEVAQLGRAFAEIQSVTVEVAEEQGELLRRGISDIFINLARRNQSLLDRQIDFIDQLESREENPDQLENLFRLDHLATRMRRNAEPLLVLAGAEPARRRGRPVELADVVRVAMGEIEDFSRINLLGLDAATVAGSVAVDLAHVLSELMENATAYSPPDTDVEVVGRHEADGSYELTLSDRGIGMSAEQLATANQTLAEPPIIGLDLSRSLGFTVVSRLAHRLGISVGLTGSSAGGVTALVTIPPDLVGSEPVQEDPAPPRSVEPTLPVEPESTGFVTGVSEATLPSGPVAQPAPIPAPVAPSPVTSDDLGSLPTRTPAEQPPAAPSWTPQPVAGVPSEPVAPVSRPAGDVFIPVAGAQTPPAPPEDPTRDLFAVLDRPADDTPPAAPTQPSDLPPMPRRIPKTPTAAQPMAPPPAAPHVVSPPPASQPPADWQSVPAFQQPAAEPNMAPRSAADVGAVDAAVTSAGLIRRTPRQVSVPENSKYARGASAAEPTMASGNRSPEEVRQMLSRYRAGLRKGRGPEPDPSTSTRRS